MSLILGFVNKKRRLVYSTHKADKMPTPRVGENRRAKAVKSASSSLCGSEISIQAAVTARKGGDMA
jgi:hypothetical protein